MRKNRTCVHTCITSKRAESDGHERRGGGQAGGLYRGPARPWAGAMEKRDPSDVDFEQEKEQEGKKAVAAAVHTLYWIDFGWSS